MVTLAWKMFDQHFREELERDYNLTPKQYREARRLVIAYLMGNFYFGVHIGEILPVKDVVLDMAVLGAGVGWDELV